MLGNYRVAAQLVAPRVVLSSTEWVSYYIIFILLYLKSPLLTEGFGGFTDLGEEEKWPENHNGLFPPGCLFHAGASVESIFGGKSRSNKLLPNGLDLRNVPPVHTSKTLSQHSTHRNMYVGPQSGQFFPVRCLYVSTRGHKRGIDPWLYSFDTLTYNSWLHLTIYYLIYTHTETSLWFSAIYAGRALPPREFLVFIYFRGCINYGQI
jgi:hypothetical protein